jgi:nucleoside-diphosphate-sugar epimerase
MASHSKRVLVTGISSFTGIYLKEKLATRGFEVFGCDVSINEDNHNFKCDIRNKDNVRECFLKAEPHYVVHLGAITYVPHSDAEMIYNVNVIGTLNILEVCGERSGLIKKIILPSTANVYGNSTEGIVGESGALTPVSHYGVSKLAMENIAKLYYGKLPIIVTRPFNYTGKGQDTKFIIPKIVKHFKDKESVISMGTTSVIRDFSDVRFVTECYAQLLESAAFSVEVNICSGHGTSLDDVIDYLRLLTGNDIKIEVNPEYVRVNEIQTLIGDNSLLLKILPEIKTIDIKETVKWMLAE